MSTTLTVKNEHTDPVVITPDDGSDPVTVDARSTAELAAAYLRGRSFQQLLEQGKVRFDDTASPTPEQYRLARQVLSPIVQRLGGSALSLLGQMNAGKQVLQADAEGYNRRWSLVRESLVQAEAAEKGTEFLAEGARHYLNTTPEEEAVEEVEEAIAELEGEDLDATGRTLAEWYAERRAKEDELKAAQANLEAVRLEQAELQRLIEALAEAAAAFQDTDPAQDIGTQLTAWWED
jgi:chromosome segregation ATPase